MDDKEVFLGTLDLRGLSSGEGFANWIGGLRVAREFGRRIVLDVEYTDDGFPWRISARAIVVTPTEDSNGR